MPKLIDSLPKKTLDKHVANMVQSILEKQWMEKKAQLLQLVTPTLISLWLKTKFKLDSEEFKPFFLLALKHRGKEARFSAADFLAKSTMIPKAKKQIVALCA